MKRWQVDAINNGQPIYRELSIFFNEEDFEKAALKALDLIPEEYIIISLSEVEEEDG